MLSPLRGSNNVSLFSSAGVYTPFRRFFSAGVYTPFRHFFRQGFTPHFAVFFRQGFTPPELIIPVFYVGRGLHPISPFFFRQGFTPPACEAVTLSGFRYFFNSWAIKSFSFFAASNFMLSSVGRGTGFVFRRLKVSDEQASRSPLMVV